MKIEKLISAIKKANEKDVGDVNIKVFDLMTLVNEIEMSRDKVRRLNISLVKSELKAIEKPLKID